MGGRGMRACAGWCMGWSLRLRFSHRTRRVASARGAALLVRRARWGSDAPTRAELVLDERLQDHGVAVPGEAEARAELELEAREEGTPVEHREDVVLLLAARVDVADLADVAVELDGAAFLAHRRQLEDRVQVERERADVLRDDRPELELEVGFLVVRHLGLEVPAEIEEVSALVEHGAAHAGARARVLELVRVLSDQVDVGRDVDLVGEA